VIAEYDGAGNLLSEYVYANGQRIAKMDPDGTMDYYLNDHAGGPAQVLGSARAMAGSGWSANYYPFGEIASQTGSEEDTHFDFTGQERDRETGLMYFGARYYNPAIGRWMSVDPMAAKYPGLSPYNYCLNSPINNFDPDGGFVFSGAAAVILTGAEIAGIVVVGIAAASIRTDVQTGRPLGTTFNSLVKTITDISVDVQTPPTTSTELEMGIPATEGVDIGDQMTTTIPDKTVVDQSNSLTRDSTGKTKTVDQANQGTKTRLKAEQAQTREKSRLRRGLDPASEYWKLKNDATKPSEKNQRKKDLLDKTTDLLGGPGT
jgi:RHS repeat-associated protein